MSAAGRRRKDPFADKENVRHFRLVHRPAGEDAMKMDKEALSFEEMFEEYDPVGKKDFYASEETEEVLETEEFYEEEDTTGVDEEDEDNELVDIDAEMDQFAEDFIDIEGDEVHDQVRPARFEEKVGESAKYGILYDDRNYDYTKHLRFMGVTPGAVFVSAPGSKKSAAAAASVPKQRDFFADAEPEADEEMDGDDFEAEKEPEIILKDVLASHESARQQYRSLLHQASDDPVLKEVLEALEDDRFVSGEVDDELVLALDNINIHDDQNESDDFFNDNSDDDDYYGSDVDIIGENETISELVPSTADLKERMELLEQNDTDEESEFDKILDEYGSEEVESEIDIIGEDSHELLEDEEKEDYNDYSSEDEEAKEVLNYLREHGRARGTTLYDKKRPSHLPPIHIAIAQYSELRRELVVDNDQIIKKYAQEDLEQIEEEVRESERIIESMVRVYNREEDRAKDINIESAKWLQAKANEKNKEVSGPRMIVEESKSAKKQQHIDIMSCSESESEDEELLPKINKGLARSGAETAEEKKARKASIKAEKREKRADKKSAHLDPFVHVKKSEGGSEDVDLESFLKEFESSEDNNNNSNNNK